METSILHQIKRKAGKFIEQQLLKTGRVLEVRPWESGTMIEIDLHLPFADIKLWNEAPYIKVRVEELCFRDYTPFGWEAETNTCSLLIDIIHEGPGSRWAKHVHAGDPIEYLKIDSTRQLPHPTNLVVGLGDASSMGHLLALRQLTLPAIRFDGAILLDSPQTGELFNDYFYSKINALPNYDQMAEWLLNQSYCTTHTSFYLAGNQQMVVGLRSLLKSIGHSDIHARRFWN